MAATYAQVGVPQDSPDGDRAVFAPVEAHSPNADRLAFGTLTDRFGVTLIFGTVPAD
ncbi:hypothetical protein KIH74_32325 [Kineosporia sp. J2-2]|uniref:Uncharacterized protein n=1 Tax=Kineosporia corallincola TaxID=2835133 RepID=A0ABS5TSB7_9ACTN|nr:hypothetical protein [Kineosporia corallincola]MBT0773676.1 hypothetical protein [Kineosporia corallincola]